jgi:alpha-ribazole phosphatase
LLVGVVWSRLDGGNDHDNDNDNDNDHDNDHDVAAPRPPGCRIPMSGQGLACLVDLLRHGEAAGGPCFRGSRDDPLTERGWSELRAATADDGPGWDAVLCSPARRCADFARALGARLDLPVTTLPKLRERHFGSWEGRTAAELPEADLAAFWSDPVGFTPPGAEPFGAFRARVLAAWQEIQGGAGEHRLILTHGGVVRVIVGEVLRMPPAALLLLEVPHACRTRIRLPGGPGLPSLVAHGG